LTDKPRLDAEQVVEAIEGVRDGGPAVNPNDGHRGRHTGSKDGLTFLDAAVAEVPAELTQL
jgi:hypothetical protein